VATWVGGGKVGSEGTEAREGSWGRDKASVSLAKCLSASEVSCSVKFVK
jgi:hypothetical protein